MGVRSSAPAEGSSATSASCSPTVGQWNPDVMCGNFTAGERAAWLVQYRAMTHEAAAQVVIQEFPAMFGAGPWNPEALCEGVRAEERAQWLIGNQGLTHDAAVQRVMGEFPHVFSNAAGSNAAGSWDPDVMCSDSRAEERVQWLMTNRGKNRQEAIDAVMSEFPAQFQQQKKQRTSQVSAASIHSRWNPDAMCDGSRAEERAAWLVANQGMDGVAAQERVMNEFPQSFSQRERWNSDAMCDGVRAEEMAAWLVANQGMDGVAAQERVMNEFPQSFSQRERWNSDAMCDGVCARERAAWLVANKGMTGETAQTQVMQEFPSAFSAQGNNPGAPQVNTPGAVSMPGYKPDVICDGKSAEERVLWVVANCGLPRESAEQRVMSEFPGQFGASPPAGINITASAPMAAVAIEPVVLEPRQAAPESTWGSSMQAPIRGDPPLFPTIDHPVRPLHISSELSSKPIPTNKFIGNLLVGSNNQPIWTHPYILRPKIVSPFGLSACCAPSKTFGPPSGQNRQKFYFSVPEDSFGAGALEFGSEPCREIVYLDELCVGAELRFSGGGAATGSLVSPLVRGMAYVSFTYDSLTPVVFTKDQIVSINGQQVTPQQTTLQAADKYAVQLSTGQCWLLYSLDGPIQLSVRIKPDQCELVASAPFSGTLRCAMLPTGADPQVLDNHVRTVPFGCDLVTTETGYSLHWKTRGGDGNQLLHYSMLHHRASMINPIPTDLTVESTTKGPMVGYVGNEWNIQVQLPSINWLPPLAPDASKVDAIRCALIQDVKSFQPEGLAAKFPDNYFAGKELHKFALLVLVADSLGEADVRGMCLDKVKTAIVPFLTGSNQNPLKYDRTWGGIVGCRGLQGNVHADFGSSLYNDHHYHWGYFIQTAAIIAHFDTAWASQNRVWVEALIRDVTNPSAGDPYFTPWRCFDWYSGHCWSQGLFESRDGKDQESTSEEVNYHYGVMLWGMACGNTQLEKLGRLMLSVATRSIQTYFLMDSDNKAHPLNFIGNKVTGIFFENKADYTTWFGENTEFIHGIQMLPLTPISEYVRAAKFVAEEWSIIQETAHQVSSGWKGVLWTNYSIVNREESFRQLQTAPLDPGLSRTWALFFAATRPTPNF